MIEFKTRLYFTGQESMITYSQKVNLCQYPVSSLKGFGLWADDITKYFDNSIKRSIL